MTAVVRVPAKQGRQTCVIKVNYFPFSTIPLSWFPLCLQQSDGCKQSDCHPWRIRLTLKKSDLIISGEDAWCYFWAIATHNLNFRWFIFFVLLWLDPGWSGICKYGLQEGWFHVLFLLYIVIHLLNFLLWSLVLLSDSAERSGLSVLLRGETPYHVSRK